MANNLFVYTSVIRSNNQQSEQRSLIFRGKAKMTPSSKLLQEHIHNGLTGNGDV